MRATRYDRYRCAQNADHFAHNSPFSAFFAEVVCTLGMTPPRTVISPPPKGVCTTSMEGTARPAGPGCGARGRRRGLAGLVTAIQAPPVRRVPEGQAAVPVGGGRAWPGFEATRPATHSDTSAAGVEGPEGQAAVPVGGAEPGRASHSDTGAAGAEGAGGPGCGARGRRRGLAGLRDDAPSHTQRHKRRRCGGCRRARRARARFEPTHQSAPTTGRHWVERPDTQAAVPMR